jgi:divalent metal cation (Fe/Co/Zn/Cd) transporter
MDGAASIGDAHLLTERVETFLRGRVPNLGRVVIHVEPHESSAQ